MNTSILSALFAVSVAAFAQGCASESASSADETSADISTVSADNATVLADVLSAAKAPSNQAPMTVGTSSHVARITLTTVNGGMAKFISESGSVSTVDGTDLGDLADLNIAWTPVRDALVAGGAKFTTVTGTSGASSSTLVASVECKQVVSPSAKPSCSVTPITMTEDDNSALMTALVNSKAPNSALTGVDDLTGVFSLTTAQGGEAKFVSQGLELTSTDGKKLADIASVGVDWMSIQTALLDAGMSWETTAGAHGSSSSTLDATVSCHRVVAPQARATCTVTAN